MEKLRGLFVYGFGFFSISIVVILLYLFNSKHRAIRKVWAKVQTTVMGAEFQTFKEADKEAKIYIINHRSMLDIIALEALLDGNPCWIGKKEITKIPFFGRIMSAPKMITIDRQDKRGIIHLIKEVKNRLEDNREIMIFPEGTRSFGEGLKKFKSGAKIIAEKYNLKVQPVVLVGSEFILDSKKIKTHPGKLEVHFLKSFTPKKDTPWYEDLEKEMGDLFVKRYREYRNNFGVNHEKS